MAAAVAGDGADRRADRERAVVGEAAIAVRRRVEAGRAGLARRARPLVAALAHAAARIACDGDGVVRAVHLHVADARVAAVARVARIARDAVGIGVEKVGTDGAVVTGPGVAARARAICSSGAGDRGGVGRAVGARLALERALGITGVASEARAAVLRQVEALWTILAVISSPSVRADAKTTGC